MESNRGKSINYILLSLIIIMPFIIIISTSPLLDGKYYYLLFSGIVLLILSFKINRTKLSSIDIMAILFIISIFISSVFSPDKYTAFFGSFSRGEGFFSILVYIIVFFCASRYLDITEKSLNIILISSCVMAIHGILQFYGIDFVKMIVPLYGNEASDAVGTIGNRNFFSNYICIFLFLSMGLYIFKNKIRYLIYSLILFTALMCSLTRSGWLAFVVFSILGLAFIIRRKDCLKRAGIVLLSFLLIFIVLNVTTDNSIINRSNKNQIVSDNGELTGSAGGRAEILRISFDAFLDKPFLGYGPDTLKYRLSEEYTDEFTSYFIEHGAFIDKAHNEFLEYAVSCGIFTLVCYLILLILIIVRLWKNKKDDINKILLITIIAYLVQSFFNISMIAVAPTFWILLGFSYRCVNKYKLK